MRKVFSSAELVLVKKDLHLLWARRGVRALLIAMPLFLVIALPVIFFVSVSLFPQTVSQPRVILEQLSLQSGELDFHAFWAEVFTEFVCPMLYAFVPVICAVAAGSCVFVSEKENGTLDALFLSSMRAKSVYNAKVTACTLIAVLISWTSFFAFAITASISELLIGAPFFFNLSWLVLGVLVSPALSLFSVVFTGLILPRVHTMAESLQTMGYLLLPIAAAYLLRFVGVISITPATLLLCAVVLVVAALVLFNRTSARFHAEALSDPAAEKSPAGVDNPMKI